MARISPGSPARVLVLAGLLLAPVAGRAAEPIVHSVRIEAFTFVPARLEVRAGDTVIWINEDLVPHTATGGDPGWDTGPLTRATAPGMAFAVPGTFAYRCLYHPQMRGEIVVLSRRAERPSSQPLSAAPVQ